MRVSTADERGSATVLVLAIVAALVTVATLMLAAGETVIQAIKTQHAADLAAVAAADALRGLNSGYPCQAAELVAQANKREVLDCKLIDSDVVVTLQASSAKARAGPPQA